MSGHFYCLIDDITNCGDVSLNAVYLCDSKGGYKYWEPYIVSRFDKKIKKINVVNNVDMSRSKAPWPNGPYKNLHTEQHNNT